MKIKAHFEGRTRKNLQLYSNSSFAEPGKYEKITNFQTKAISGTAIEIDLQNEMK